LICPYCLQDTERGFIPAYEDTIRWYPESLEYSIFEERKMEERKIKLSRRNGTSIAHYCENCQKIFIDIKEQDTRSTLTYAVEKTKQAYKWYQKKWMEKEN